MPDSTLTTNDLRNTSAAMFGNAGSGIGKTMLSGSLDAMDFIPGSKIASELAEAGGKRIITQSTRNIAADFAQSKTDNAMSALARSADNMRSGTKRIAPHLDEGIKAGRLYGHNEYIVKDPNKARNVKKALSKFYSKHCETPEVLYTNDVGGAAIDTVNGKIRIDKTIRDQYPELHDGYLMEELQHFHQLHSRGWLGRELTTTENQLLENEVVGRLLKSGLELFDPR